MASPSPQRRTQVFVVWYAAVHIMRRGHAAVSEARHESVSLSLRGERNESTQEHRPRL